MSLFSMYVLNHMRAHVFFYSLLKIVMVCEFGLN